MLLHKENQESLSLASCIEGGVASYLHKEKTFSKWSTARTMPHLHTAPPSLHNIPPDHHISGLSQLFKLKKYLVKDSAKSMQRPCLEIPKGMTAKQKKKMKTPSVFCASVCVCV